MFYLSTVGILSSAGTIREGFSTGSRTDPRHRLRLLCHSSDVCYIVASVYEAFFPLPLLRFLKVLISTVPAKGSQAPG